MAPTSQPLRTHHRSAPRVEAQVVLEQMCAIYIHTFLGLLAKIKCSICSEKCNNFSAVPIGIACYYSNFSWGCWVSAACRSPFRPVTMALHSSLGRGPRIYPSFLAYLPGCKSRSYLLPGMPHEQTYLRSEQLPFLDQLALSQHLHALTSVHPTVLQLGIDTTAAWYNSTG